MALGQPARLPGYCHPFVARPSASTRLLVQAQLTRLLQQSLAELREWTGALFSETPAKASRNAPLAGAPTCLYPLPCPPCARLTLCWAFIPQHPLCSHVAGGGGAPAARLAGLRRGRGAAPAAHAGAGPAGRCGRRRCGWGWGLGTEGLGVSLVCMACPSQPASDSCHPAADCCPPAHFASVSSLLSCPCGRRSPLQGWPLMRLAAPMCWAATCRRGTGCPWQQRRWRQGIRAPRSTPRHWWCCLPCSTPPQHREPAWTARHCSWEQRR